MTANELMDMLNLCPNIIKDVAAVTICMSLIEIAPVKVNPWKWLKSFWALPSRIDELERAFERDRAHRWRTQILKYSDCVRKGVHYSKETWDDLIDSIDHYNMYCANHTDFKNGRTTAAMAFLNKAYAELLEDPDGFLQ